MKELQEEQMIVSNVANKTFHTYFSNNTLSTDATTFPLF